MKKIFNREFYSLKEVASLLGVHYMTVWRYVASGKLKGRRLLGRWYVERASLDVLLNKGFFDSYFI